MTTIKIKISYEKNGGCPGPQSRGKVRGKNGKFKIRDEIRFDEIWGEINPYKKDIHGY